MITSPPETATVFDGQSYQTPPNLVVNGGFETYSYNSQTGNYSIPDWTFSNFLYPPSVTQVAHGGSVAGAFVTYPATNLGTLSQAISDQAGATYKIDLFGIPSGGSTGNTIAIQWDGTTVLAQSNVPSITTLNPTSASQYVEYTVDVTGTGSDLLAIILGTGYYWNVDDISVTQVTTPGTEQQAGAITFTDADAGDTHTVSYVADGQNYLGTFTAALATDATGGKTGSVDWSFSVADSVLSSLGAQQTIVQAYTVSIDDHHGGVAQQNVTVDITNPDHAPVIVVAPTSAAVTSNLDAAASTTNLIQDPVDSRTQRPTMASAASGRSRWPMATTSTRIHWRPTRTAAPRSLAVWTGHRCAERRGQGEPVGRRYGRGRRLHADVLRRE